MTRRTTTEWETLLDNGAKTAPWEARSTDEGDPVIVGVMPDWGIEGDVAFPAGPEIARLMAAAPEAVTELVYMRGALDSLVIWCETKAMKARNYPRPSAQKQMERTAIIYEELARRVTEILETDLNEEDDYDVHGDVDE